MRKALFTITVALLAVAAQAQIKVHNDGQVSIGSLSTNYGVQFRPFDYTSFRSQNNDEWSWVELSCSDVTKQKHWIVNNLNQPNAPHTFFVTTDGYIYKRGSWRAADGSMMDSNYAVNNAGAILDSITGVWYTPIDDSKGEKRAERRMGVLAQEVKNMLPEAVTTDEKGLMYVDYEALTVVLIEAVKEQRQEIIELRKTLEENGLMKKQHKTLQP